MTLAIAVATGDGVVVAADSRTSFSPSDGPWRVLSDFTHKVFKAGQCAVATYGYAFLLGRNVAGHMTTFVASLGEKELAPGVLAARVGEFFGELIERHYEAGNDVPPPAGASALGFLVGGFEEGIPKIYEVSLPGPDITCITPDGSGAAWRGQTDVVTRLLFGIDLGVVEQVLVQENGDENERDTLMQRLRELSPLTQYAIPFEVLNLQDGIDFASLAIRTTIDVQRLTHGVLAKAGSWPGVGGPIEIAVIQPTGGFAWVQQTTLQGERPAGIAEI